MSTTTTTNKMNSRSSKMTECIPDDDRDDDSTDTVKVKVRWARTVIMETIVEVPNDPNLFEGDEYVGDGEYELVLPSVFESGKTPDHVMDIQDEENIWEVNKVDG